jgi:hypothetical protein
MRLAVGTRVIAHKIGGDDLPEPVWKEGATGTIINSNVGIDLGLFCLKVDRYRVKFDDGKEWFAHFSQLEVL